MLVGFENFSMTKAPNESQQEEELDNQEFILEIIAWILFIGILYFAVKGSLVLSLQTTSPMVGVSGDSMTHPGDNLWNDWYLEKGFENVTSFPFQDGLHNGDLVILKGVHSFEDINIGDVIVYMDDEPGDREKVIHRVAVINKEGGFIRTRSDKYGGLDPKIQIDDVIGKAVLSVPYLGYPAR